MVWEWRLSTADGSLAFGDDSSLIVVEEWGIKPGKLRTSDRENPRADFLRPGRDFRSGQAITFEMWVNGGTEVGALAGLAEMQRLWRNDSGRSFAGSLASLMHPDGRIVYGRPREFQFDPRRIQRGQTRIDATFDCFDDLWYGPEVLVDIPLVTQATGGLPIPAAVPFVIGGGTGQSDRTVVVDGNTTAWPVLTLHGPVKDPWIDVPGVGRLNFKVDLAWDQSLTVDTRPWNRSIMRDGADLPGALLPSGLRLSDMAMRPGAYRIVFGGYDPTSTSRLTVQVEPAYTSF